MKYVTIIALLVAKSERVAFRRLVTLSSASSVVAVKSEMLCFFFAKGVCGLDEPFFFAVLRNSRRFLT